MIITNSIIEKFNDYKQLNSQFNSGKHKNLIFDNFLPESIVASLSHETDRVSEENWKLFQRNQTSFQECVNLSILPEFVKLLGELHSKLFLEWLGNITGIDRLLPDPYMIGGGYLRSGQGDCLLPHVDFNWNDHIRMYRCLTLLIYITPNWKSEWGGNLKFFDDDNNKVIQEVDYTYNRAVLWKDQYPNYHGYPEKINCPKGVYRKSLILFYYTNDTSTFNKNDPPHRSLYWFDKEKNKPYDIRTN
jgi:hypothetical protein